MSKVLCEEFGTCHQSEYDLVRMFNLGSKMIEDSQCGRLLQLAHKVEDGLLMRLIQGNLHDAIVLQTSPDEGAPVVGYASTLSVIPLVSDVDSGIGDQLNDLMQPKELSMIDQDVAVQAFGLYRTVIGEMDGIDCAHVGSVPSYGELCPEDSGTYPLAGGRYVATSDISSRAKIALDIRDMRNAKSASKDIYLNGKYSTIDEENDGSKRSLSGMSQRAAMTMGMESTYNLFKYAFLALSDGGGKFDGEPEGEFADSIVNDLYEVGRDSLAIDAAMVMNLWMYVVHNLHDSVKQCQSQSDELALRALDKAAAYWIGDDQDEGIPNGHLLYAMTERIAGKFGQQGNGEAPANAKIIDMMNSMKDDYFLAGECGNDATAFQYLRVIVDKIIAQMTVPLIQKLIDSMQDVNEYAVELYGVSLIGLVAGCSDSVYNGLLDNFVPLKYTDASKFDEILGMLQSTYDCLGVSCRDIGAYMTDVVPECTDISRSVPLAGYVPSTDVHPHAKIDLDIYQIGILMEMGAYEAAKEYFMYGRNSVYEDDESGKDLYRTLDWFASDDRSQTPEYQTFVDYFDGDANYGKTQIMKALNNQGLTKNAPNKSQSDYVVTLLQSMVMYMHSLHEMYRSLSACEDGDDDAGGLWDMAAAYVIGSMEGSQAGGNSDGQLMYGMSKVLCEEFGNCSYDGEILKLFNVGQQEIKSGSNSCNKLKGVIGAIEDSLVVVLIQDVLSKAVELETMSDVTLLGAARASTLAVIPIVAKGDASAAETLFSLMVPRSIDYLKANVANSVFEAMRVGVDQMYGVDCEDIGALPVYGSLCMQHATASSTFAFGRYINMTNVYGQSLISRDVRAIRMATDYDEARAVYEHSQNSRVKASLPTLESMSIDASTAMKEDPTFNIFLYALSDEKLIDKSNPVEVYADTVVKDSFEVPDVDLAAEASVALNMWMFIIHKLHESIRVCKLDKDKNDDGFFPIDEAIAYWIGADQNEGEDDGDLMYAITERMAKIFGQKSGEANVNSNIIDLMNEAKKFFRLKCSSNIEPLRVIIYKIISQMTVPLIQNLIYSMYQEDQNHIELYAFAVVPLVMGCSNSTYHYLKENLIDYDFEQSKRDAIILKLQSVYDCLGVSCQDIGSYRTASVRKCGQRVGPDDIAGYPIEADLYEHSKIDLDVYQIGILLKMGAYDAAMDYYMYGRNSKYFGNDDTELYRTLDWFASDDRSQTPQYQAFVDYFGGDANYAKSLVESVLDREGRFRNISSDHVTELITIILTNVVMYMHSLHEMYKSKESCGDGDSDALEMWDMAASYLIGSMEGPRSGGSSDGQFLYNLNKLRCEEFDICTRPENDMIGFLLKGRDVVSGGDCKKLDETIDSIARLLQILLIQNTLHYSAILETEPSKRNRAAGYASALSILPLIEQANTTSAETIEATMLTNLNGDVDRDIAHVTFQAFASAITQIRDIECNDVGSLREYGGVCTNVNPSEGTSLSNGLYITSTNVGERAKIALDIRDIEQALLGGDVEMSRMIYKNGLNANKFDEKGKFIGEKWSLSGYSTSASEEMIQDSNFNIFKYALKDETGLFYDRSVDLYANTYVQRLFDKSETSAIAPEAAIVLNLWMYIVHKLYDTVSDCKKNMKITNDSINLTPNSAKGLRDNDGGVFALDEAVSYWIGDSQQTGEGNQGHLLYALTERIGEYFGQGKGSTGQAVVNTKILRLFNEAKNEIVLADACTVKSDTDLRLRRIADKITRQMTIPLVQSLIHNMVINDKERVKLYAISFVPLIAGCSPSTFIYLKQKLILGEYIVAEFDEIMERLQPVYGCLGFSCQEIGDYKTGTGSLCSAEPKLRPMAGYVPSSDVKEIAKIDLDILQINILMQMEAYDAVKDIYNFGKNAVINEEPLSLHHLATSSYREIVPQFKVFKAFFEENDYADSLIIKILNQQFPFNSASSQQRTALVVNTLQYMVMYMYALREIYDAVNDCEAGDATRNSDGLVSWDKAAAFLIGSIEGIISGGSRWVEDGQLLFGLAKQQCFRFGTCAKSGNANLNVELIELLYAGKGELESMNCDALKKTSEEIVPLLMIPLIQGTLRSAMVNEDLTYFTASKDLASGYIYSHSILPLIKAVDTTAASVIKKNMDFQFTVTPVSDGAFAIFKAFEQAIPKIGVNCRDVGRIDSMGVCPGDASSASGFGNYAWIVTLVSVSISHLVAFKC